MKQFIHLEVELYQKYGLVGGCIVQFLQSEDGEFVGTIKDLCDRVGIFDLRQIKYVTRELEEKKVISKDKVSAWYFDFILLKEEKEKKKKEIPKSVQELMKKIEQDKKNKANKVLEG